MNFDLEILKMDEDKLKRKLTSASFLLERMSPEFISKHTNLPIDCVAAVYEQVFGSTYFVEKNVENSSK